MADLPTGTVTFLFTDIEGSTELLTALGTDYHALLSQHNALIRAELGATGGVEVKTEGDAFFAAFTDATAALAAAAAAQRALAGAAWPAGRQVRVRMGIHTGRGTLSEGDYVGIDVNLAARIAAAAHGGEVVLSDATRSLAERALPAGSSLRSLGEHVLKDFPAPVQLYQLVVDGLEQDFAPLRTLRPGNLPEPLTTFVGREEELAEVSRLLETSRLVTLTGPGGTGKTRLSIEVANRVSAQLGAGAWFVPLETIADADLVLPEIGRTLSIREEAGRPMVESLAAALGTRQLLMVLDNVEQVVDCGPQLASLLAAASGPRFLCSSREPLRISGEQQYAVPPLDSDPAVRLFIERARLVRPDFDPAADDRQAIAAICVALDGLPLAIELAAARVRLFPPRTLLARLSDRLNLLAGGRDLPERQRTLRGAIDWSYDLLPAAERQFFARLGVFAGHPEVAAVEAVVDPAGDLGIDAYEAVERLVDKSLLTTRDDPRGLRVGYLETIRGFAREHLAAGGEEPAVRRRHADYYVALCERYEPELMGTDPARYHDALEADRDEISALVRWSLEAGERGLGLRACAAIWRFWHQRGFLREGRAMLEKLLAAPQEVGDLERARGLTALGGVAYWQNESAVARRAYEEALELNRRLGDSRAIAGSLYDLSFTLSIAGELDAAAAMVEESLRRYQELGDHRGVALAREAQAVAALRVNEFEAARNLEEEVVASYRAAGLPYKISDGLSLLSAIALHQQDVPAARRFIGESAGITRRLGDQASWAVNLEVAAVIACREGSYVRAAFLLGAFVAREEALGPSLRPAAAMGLEDPATAVRERLAPDVLKQAMDEGRQADLAEIMDDIEHLADQPEGG